MYAFSGFILQVTNNIPEDAPAHLRILMLLKMCWNRKEYILVVSATNDNEALSELRHAIMNSIEQSKDSLVANFLELLQDDFENFPWLSSFIHRNAHETFYILKHEEPWTNLANHTNVVHEQ